MAELMDMKRQKNRRIRCRCGRIHRIRIQKILIKPDCAREACEFAHRLSGKRTVILCDQNTRDLAGEPLHRILTGFGRSAELYVIGSRNGHDIAPSDGYLGQILADMPVDADFFIAAGSGTINDLTRQISFKMGKPYMVYATAPSMDGYASVTSSLILGHTKVSVPGQVPAGIFADTGILASAPADMISAGFGDLMSKYNAIREWNFARKHNGEQICETVAEYVLKTVQECEKLAGEIQKRSETAVTALMEGLIRSGMAISLYGNTRPASGAEHHLVHYWDVSLLRRGARHPLHGNAAGVGTLVLCRFYELLEKHFPVEVPQLNRKRIQTSMEQAGCPTSPKTLGIPRMLFRESIILGHTMSQKFTALTYFAKENPEMLRIAAEELSDIFYA